MENTHDTQFVPQLSLIASHACELAVPIFSPTSHATGVVKCNIFVQLDLKHSKHPTEDIATHYN